MFQTKNNYLSGSPRNTKSPITIRSPLTNKSPSSSLVRSVPQSPFSPKTPISRIRGYTPVSPIKTPSPPAEESFAVQSPGRITQLFNEQLSASSSNAPLPDLPFREALPHFNNLAINKYGTIVEIIGQGSYGTVYKTDREYAMKVITHDKKNTLQKDILKEIVYASSLNHPGIIKYLDIYNSEEPEVAEYLKAHINHELNHTVLVMKLYTGSLGGLMIDDIDFFRTVAFQIVTSMAYLSSRNIIHCDIKPENIYYRHCPINPEKLETVIADFGISTHSECQINLDRKGQAVTLGYRSPDLAVSYVENIDYVYDSKIDVWAAACTLYQIYTGRMLFIPPTYTTQPEIQKAKIALDPQIENKELLLEIFDVLGTPTPEDGPVYNYFKILGLPAKKRTTTLTDNEDLNQLLQAMLQYNPDRRINFFIAQGHRFFHKINVNNLECFQGQLIEHISCYNKTLLFQRDQQYDRLLKMNINSSLSNNVGVLSNWLLNMSTELNFIDALDFGSSKIVILAMQLLYTYLDHNITPPYNLQLVGVACEYIAASFLIGRQAGSVVLHYVKQLFDRASIFMVAIDILKTINYDLLATTYWDQINSFNLNKELSTVANRLLMLYVPSQASDFPYNIINDDMASNCINAATLLMTGTSAEKQRTIDFLEGLYYFHGTEEGPGEVMIMLLGYEFSHKVSDIISRYD